MPKHKDPLLKALIDRGKECVGLAVEIFTLFEYGESEW